MVIKTWKKHNICEESTSPNPLKAKREKSTREFRKA
jgi:hypothetical protein